jgi:hypothetical protein
MNAKICTAILIGTSLMITSMINFASAEESIGIFLLQSEIDKTDSIFVNGFVNVELSHIPVRLEVYDPNNDLIFRPGVATNDEGQFGWLFHPPLGKFSTTGTYTVIASHEELEETATTQFTVIEDTSIANPRLENIKDGNSVSESEQSNIFSGTVVQNDAGSNTDEPSIQRENTDVSQEETAIKTDVQKGPIQEMMESIETAGQHNESEEGLFIITTAIAFAIAGIVSGTVLWMRATHLKPTVQK